MAFHLNHLFEKSLCYYHQKKIFKISLEEGATPTELKLKKNPAFLLLTDELRKKWDANIV